MATFEYNDKLKFMLPAGFILSRDKDDEGDEVVNILTGEYENDEGETDYKFSCRVNYDEYDPSEVDDEVSSDNLLDLLAERMENSRCMKLPGAPKTILLNKAMPISIFGHLLKMYASIVLVQVDDWSVMQLITTGTYNDDDPSVNTERYENLFEVLKAARIKGKKLPVESVSPYEIEEALQLTFEENGEAIDVSPKLQFNFTVGDETTTYEYTAEGMKEIGKERLTRVTPDEELYPHYNGLRFAGGPVFPGVKVVVNNSGTEYNFIPFRYAADDDEVDEDMKALYNRVIAKDTESYDLHEKAREMQKLFHVNESAFDPHHDRECELEEGLMHRAYMMSGLRSFAWTLADYCKQHDCTPEDVDISTATRIADFVADEDWLNYDGDTYCKGLCSGSDLHVYFIPDSVSQADRKKLLPTKEDYDRVKKMKEVFPTYREILSEIHSLNALRKDLKYIYPAIKVLWDNLEEDRNYDEALLGNAADIVYAWCALALAAKEPFFSEDGPMTCYFSQRGDIKPQTSRGDRKPQTSKRSISETDLEEYAASRVDSDEETTEEWMRKYGDYLEDDPVIDFNGTLFVFSGLSLHSLEKDDPIVQKVIEKGGQYRSKVSGLTNYLVVDPRYAGHGKMDAAIEQLQKGKNIKVILLEDLLMALGVKNTTKPSKTASSNTNDNTVTKGVHKEKAVTQQDCEIDSSGVLTGYSGSAKKIILPNGITAIGEDAFLSNENINSVVIPEGVEKIEDGAFWMCANLKSVVLPSTIQKIGANAFNSSGLTSIVIPDGCEEIGADCFTNCNNLKDIYVSASVYDIGDDAFCTFNDAMVIHTSRGSAADSFAKEHGWKVDYKSAPSAKPQTSSKKSSTSKSTSASVDEVSGLADTMSELSARITEMQNQDLSEEDRKTLDEAMGTLDNIMDDLHEGQTAMEKYDDYLEQQEAREKAQEEEKARKKAEAMAAGKSEKDIVNMYVILTNEKKLGKLNRSRVEFCKIYEDDFAALSNAEIIQTREDILSKMEDEVLCAYYTESFKQRSTKDRFTVSTLNLNNVSDEPDYEKRAEFAIENTKEWFKPEEYPEVRKLMDSELADTRKDIDDQLKAVEEGWMKFSSAIEFLQLNIAKKEPHGSDMQDNWSCFQLVMGSNLVSVKLSTKGIFMMRTNVMNLNPWYWGVTIRDIWEAAFKNEIKDERDGAYDTNQIANQAMSQIRAKYPETKATSAPDSNFNRNSTLSSNERQAFEQQIRSLIALSKEPIFPHVEDGVEKSLIVSQIISMVKELIGDGTSFSSGLSQYDNNAALETLRQKLGRKVASAEEIIDAIIAKKSAEYDRISALLEKKNSDIRNARQEAAKLEEERSHLGIFHGKRKKEIAALLEQIQARIKQIEDNYEYEKKHL